MCPEAMPLTAAPNLLPIQTLSLPPHDDYLVQLSSELGLRRQNVCLFVSGSDT